MDEHDDQRPRLNRPTESAAAGDDRSREGLHRTTQRAGLRDQAGQYLRVEGIGVLDAAVA